MNINYANYMFALSATGNGIVVDMSSEEGNDPSDTAPSPDYLHIQQLPEQINQIQPTQIQPTHSNQPTHDANALNKICKKFKIAKCICGEFVKEKNLHTCGCGKRYCHACVYYLRNAPAFRTRCIKCNDSICNSCEADNCVECNNVICIKSANAYHCKVFLCEGCDGRICCWDVNKLLHCRACLGLYCTSCMWRKHRCKPRLHSCGDITYNGEVSGTCPRCEFSACGEHVMSVRICISSHSMYDLIICLRRIGIYVPAEILYIIREKLIFSLDI